MHTVFLVIHAKPGIRGEKIRDFVHRPQLEQGVYVWQNRALTIEEYTKVVRKVVEDNRDLLPYARFEVAPAAGKDSRIVELERQVNHLTEMNKALRAGISRPPVAQH